MKYKVSKCNERRTMKYKVSKWALAESHYRGNLKDRLYLSRDCGCRKHTMVTIDDENILFLQTREIARNFGESFENVTPKRVRVVVS